MSACSVRVQCCGSVSVSACSDMAPCQLRRAMAPCQLAVLWLRVISPCYYVWVWPLLVSLPALAVAVLVPTPRAFAVLWPMAGAPRCVGRAIRASSNKHLACSGVCRTPFLWRGPLLPEVAVLQGLPLLKRLRLAA
jgi:hypothetical protein